MSTNGQKHQFIKKVLWFLPFYLFTFLPLNLVAQTFLDRLQKPVDGQGTVTVHQDTAINRIVLDPQSTVKPEDRKATTTTSNTASTATTTTTGTTTTSTETTTTTTTPTTTTTRTRHTINGYKVQAFAGSNSREDRKKAERIASEIRAQLPNVSVSAHFYSPRWVCRVGNYRTREEAQQMLTTLKNMGYSQALIVKSKVSVY